MKTESFGLRHVLVIAAYIATLAMNFISQSAGNTFFPRTVAQIAEQYRIFFLPAGYVFAIWGVIYLGLGAFVVYHSSAAGRRNQYMPRAGWLFILSSVANMGWLALFLNSQFALSTAAMLILLASLLGIYTYQGIGVRAVSGWTRWATFIPYSIYLGWITVATVANITYVLFDAGQANWLGIAGETWAAIMVGVATLITALMLFTRRDVAYALVVIWALVGIIARYPDVTTVAVACGIAAGAIALLIVVRSLRGGTPTPQAA